MTTETNFGREPNKTVSVAISAFHELLCLKLVTTLIEREREREVVDTVEKDRSIARPSCRECHYE